MTRPTNGRCSKCGVVADETLIHDYRSSITIVNRLYPVDHNDFITKREPARWICGACVR